MIYGTFDIDTTSIIKCVNFLIPEHQIGMNFNLLMIIDHHYWNYK